jgi:hypothetical protein
VRLQHALFDHRRPARRRGRLEFKRRPRPRRGSRARIDPLVVTDAALIAAVAALAGWLAGSVTETEQNRPAPARQAVDLGPAAVAVAGSWRESERPPGVPGLDPARTAVFDPLPGLSVSAILTVAPVEDWTLVPPALAAVVRGPIPQPRKATVAGLPAWRYRDLTIARPGGMMDVTVVPTSAGTIALACVASRSLWSVANDCAVGVQRVALDGARAFAPHADLALRLRLPAVIAALDAQRVSDRRALRSTRTARGQARAATRLAAAHDSAARRLAPAAAAEGASADTVAALERVATAYRDLAVSARRERPAAFARARRDVRSADAELAAALARLR